MKHYSRRLGWDDDSQFIEYNLHDEYIVSRHAKNNLCKVGLCINIWHIDNKSLHRGANPRHIEYNLHKINQGIDRWHMEYKSFQGSTNSQNVKHNLTSKRCQLATCRF